MTRGAILFAILLMFAASASAYVGADVCNYCHSTIHAKWSDSGHPYKLTEIFGAPPTGDFPPFSAYPNDPVDPPLGYTWNDVSYTIGGYGWKMRWIDSQGYIVTSGAAENPTQYNFANGSWVNYETGNEPGTKPYNCGRCHTTGWVSDDDWDTDGDLSDNQNGLPGMHGTFFAGGVQCEQCHGEGDSHVNNPYGVDMVINTNAELCGQCHYRDSDHHIAVSGGFIKHHEQYDEWLHSPHSDPGGPGCVQCHDPHSSVIYDDEAAGEGVLPAADCAGCHPDEAAVNAHNGYPTCTDCHMPMASKSAVAWNSHKADLKTHIFAINPAPVDKTEGLFNEAGNFVLEDANGKSRMTLDFACYGCHKDPNGEGGNFSVKTLEELSAKATGIHNDGTAVAILDFDLQKLGTKVRIGWEVAEGSDMADFKLVGSQGDTQWDLSFQEDAPRSYSAIDQSDLLARGGDFSYRLYASEDGQDWQFMRSSVITLDSAPMVTMIDGAFPNPFNPHTTIKFNLAETQRVVLQIHDVNGRLVTTLQDGVLSQGPNEVVWRGMDQDGKSVSSGIYMVSLQSKNFSQTEKLVLLR